MGMQMDKDNMRALVDRAVAGDAGALDAIVLRLQDDIYNLALRTLGGRADAEDATQEILVQIVTHLAQWRGDASLRTWAWKIAARYLHRARRSKDEEVSSFEAIEQLIEMGGAEAPMPAGFSAAELEVLQEELKRACTQGMLTSLDRDQRLSWILAEVFELDSPTAADILEVDPATHRKRLSRARERLSTWMHEHCGLVNPDNPCRCRRQIPIALEVGAIDAHNLQFATHPVTAGRPWPRPAPALDDADQVKLSAYTICCHPDYAAPDQFRTRIRALIASGSLKLMN
jgi:RNA polymerase sigma factor (sigma-70 family)